VAVVTPDFDAQAPRWMRDVLRFLPLRSQFVLWGNVKDRFAWFANQDTPVPLTIEQFIAAHLEQAGVRHCLVWSLGEGLRIAPRPGMDVEAERTFFREAFNLRWDGEADLLPMSSDTFFDLLQRVQCYREEPVAVIVSSASRLIVRADMITETEHALFNQALNLSQRAVPLPVEVEGSERKVSRFHPFFWIADREGDLPDWFLLENPRVRVIPVPLPDQKIRSQVAAAVCQNLPGFVNLEDSQAKETLQAFIDQTDQLRLNDLLGVVQLCLCENLGFRDLPEGARRYRLGVTEDPWKQIDRERVRQANEFVAKRVLGQEQATTAILDIVKRAVMGLSGTGRRSNKPRGIAFLAGPTGTGKTELAKTVTQLLFGDEQAMIRFDMSEFSSEHSDQRLIGAPPGYVGYDSGGELTNAIRERPFSVVLFDEIEKAHPRILDKFLQILDDGVLTSGRGERVYFSEAFIIFTSNLGIYRYTYDGRRELNVTPAETYEEVAKRVRQGIDDYFKLELGRPEILNRLGETILVFDFIRPELAIKIFSSMLSRILNDLQEDTGIAVRLTDEALSQLANACTNDLGNGGRGIRNQLESRLINPLSRELFDGDFAPGDRVVVETVSQAPELPQVTIRSGS